MTQETAAAARPVKATKKLFVYEPETFGGWQDGHQWKFRFDNGYGASVIRTGYSYGGGAGLFELAVLGRSGRITYTTPVTEDVLGHLSVDEVKAALVEIAALGDAPKEKP